MWKFSTSTSKVSSGHVVVSLKGLPSAGPFFCSHPPILQGFYSDFVFEPTLNDM